MSEWTRLCGHAVASLQPRPMAPVDLPGLVLLRILGQASMLSQNDLGIATRRRPCVPRPTLSQGPGEMGGRRGPVY